MLTVILYLVLLSLIIFMSAFFYVFKIIGTPPKGRAVHLLQQNRPKTKRVVACIGDSLTHGNIGVCWVEQLRQNFPNFLFLNEGINGDVVWQVHQRLQPILECQPDIAIVLIGSNDAMGSLNESSGARYKKFNKLPKAPSFEAYRKSLSQLFDRLQDIPHVALCTLPPVGEIAGSAMNKHLEQFNDFIESIAKERKIQLLNVSQNMWKSLNQRNYPVIHDYDSKISVLGKRIINACFQHYVFKKPWDTIAQSQGQWLLFDQIHLGERGGQIMFETFQNYLQNIDVKNS